MPTQLPAIPRWCSGVHSTSCADMAAPPHVLASACSATPPASRYTAADSDSSGLSEYHIIILHQRHCMV